MIFVGQMPGAIPGTEVDCVDCVFFVFGKIFFSEVMEMRYMFEIFLGGSSSFGGFVYFG